MATFLELLDPETRRGMSQSFIQSGASKGMSANSIQDTLQKIGLGYRRTTLLGDVRHWKEAFSLGENMKYTTMDAKMGVDRYMETKWRTGSRFETLFRTKIKDPLTGEVTDQFVTVKHTHLEEGIEANDLSQTKTRRELQEAAEEFFKKYGIDPKDIVGPIMPIMGFYNPSVF